ncbi:MAG: flippase [Coprococcus sp.]
MSSIKKNFMYNVIYQIMLIILPLITTPYISRVLGSDGVGTYAYTYTVANYFMLAAMLGVKNYGNRSIAAVRDNKALLGKIFWQIYGLQFLCSIIALTAYFGYVFFFEENYRTIALIQGIYVLSGLLDISWFFFGLEEFKITVFRNIAVRLISLACIFIFVRTRSDLWKYTLIMTLGILCSQGYLWLYIRRMVDWYQPKAADMLKHLRSELILFIPIIAVSLYKMMDKIMLGQMSTIHQVGYYESSEKILNIPLGVITALGTVMLPRMSNLVAKGKIKESTRYIYNSMLFAMFLAAAMMFGIAGVAEDLVPVFLGEEYMPCILLLRVMTPTIPFIAWANVIRTQYLIPNHEDRSYIISVVLGAVVNLCINILLIPRLDAMGAVIGTVCAEGGVCLCQTLMVRKKLDIMKYLRDTVLFFVIGGGMLLLILSIRQLFANAIVALVIEIMAGGAVYVLVSGIYFALTHRSSVTAAIQQIQKKRGKRI